MSLCFAGDCLNPAYKDHLCFAHYERRRRGSKAADAPLQSRNRANTLREAALGYANADSDADFARAWGRLVKAAKRYR